MASGNFVLAFTKALREMQNFSRAMGIIQYIFPNQLMICYNGKQHVF